IFVCMRGTTLEPPFRGGAGTTPKASHRIGGHPSVSKSLRCGGNPVEICNGQQQRCAWQAAGSLPSMGFALDFSGAEQYLLFGFSSSIEQSSTTLFLRGSYRTLFLTH